MHRPAAVPARVTARVTAHRPYGGWPLAWILAACLGAAAPVLALEDPVPGPEAAHPGARHAAEHPGPGYVCPMHPDQVSGRAGTCPICGMDLVRAGDDEAGAGHGASGHGGAEDDPHAHHRHLLDDKGYTRSVHPYDPPDLPLVAADGRRTTLHQVLSGDRPVLLNFIFTTCTTICPALSATFAQVQSLLGSDAAQVHMVSISIDPEHDTPEQLRAYAKRFSAGPQWSFLTGDLKDVIAVQRAFDAYRGSKMNHPPLTFLRGAPREPWVRIDGIASGADVVRELRELVKG